MEIGFAGLGYLDRSCWLDMKTYSVHEMAYTGRLDED